MDNGPVTHEQFARIVEKMSDLSYEEELAHVAIKKLYAEVGNSNSHLMNSIRITKHKSSEGSVMLATGSIRVFFVGRSTVRDLPGGGGGVL
tara:strand:+ start:885 stop:1157 length:273 start_codon:yes stop_codon:yes gene_type:complete